MIIRLIGLEKSHLNNQVNLRKKTWLPRQQDTRFKLVNFVFARH
jgi:hypothetical protein